MSTETPSTSDTEPAAKAIDELQARLASGERQWSLELLRLTFGLLVPTFISRHERPGLSPDEDDSVRLLPALGSIVHRGKLLDLPELSRVADWDTGEDLPLPPVLVADITMDDLRLIQRVLAPVDPVLDDVADLTYVTLAVFYYRANLLLMRAGRSAEALTLTAKLMEEENLRRAPVVLLLAGLLLMERNRADLVASKKGRDAERQRHRERAESLLEKVAALHEEVGGWIGGRRITPEEVVDQDDRHDGLAGPFTRVMAEPITRVMADRGLPQGLRALKRKLESLLAEPCWPFHPDLQTIEKEIPKQASYWMPPQKRSFRAIEKILKVKYPSAKAAGGELAEYVNLLGFGDRDSYTDTYEGRQARMVRNLDNWNRAAAEGGL
jgi:hypothetical protein